jgi:hypothetical protein
MIFLPTMYPKKMRSDSNLGKYAKFHSLEGTLPYLLLFWFAHTTAGAINTPHGHTTHHHHLLLLPLCTPPTKYSVARCHFHQVSVVVSITVVIFFTVAAN